MIASREIARRARQLGVQPSHIERDYVLNHVLAAISEAETELTFRGGTALARVYWPDFRLSEDLDFLLAHLADANGLLAAAVDVASERTRRALTMTRRRAHEGWFQAAIEWEGGVLQVDVNQAESPAPRVDRRPLQLAYSDLNDRERLISVVALGGILADKWYLLEERDEPRDLFDLWWGLCRAGVAFEDVAESFRARYGYAPPARAIPSAERLRPLWETRLAHQIGDLPPFDEVLLATRKAFEAFAGEG